MWRKPRQLSTRLRDNDASKEDRHILYWSFFNEKRGITIDQVMNL